MNYVILRVYSFILAHIDEENFSWGSLQVTTYEEIKVTQVEWISIQMNMEVLIFILNLVWLSCEQLHLC